MISESSPLCLLSLPTRTQRVGLWPHPLLRGVPCQILGRRFFTVTAIGSKILGRDFNFSNDLKVTTYIIIGITLVILRIRLYRSSFTVYF